MDYDNSIILIKIIQGFTVGLFAHFVLKVVFDLFDINNDDDDDDPEGGIMVPAYAPM
ncbi:hypothetical protein PTIM40_140 [Cyanophage P-TIM40]|uniref:Uncharacterized protein n=1 Tax=Cyanophage P-TIM40 TaxID=1589733 RepID=A0A0C5AE05_9CAUD|nr:hypothetical protein AU107_gp140 [Cyanophage P-TIM40]AJK27567.1 hypothetical protein PTIM40_140 [Cyanophage P-TIM40]|tara:strand:- start:3175 stop:3345 length:171 start_codon:yes stop_codon:yes gene_type:complete